MIHDCLGEISAHTFGSLVASLVSRVWLGCLRFCFSFLREQHTHVSPLTTLATHASLLQPCYLSHAFLSFASPLLGFSASQLARLQQATVRRSRQLLGCLSLWLSASEMDGRCCLADRSNQREATRRIGGRGTNQSHVACIAPCPWMYSMCR